MSNKVNMGLIPDIRDSNGLWKKNICDSNKFWQTLSYRRWYNINSRCRLQGDVQRRAATYVGCINGFEDFNTFVDWSQDQIGYSNFDWQLDKDLLIKGNKIYSKDTCVFLPKRINSLIVACDSSRGEYPIGVTFSKRESKFRSFCRDSSGKNISLGYYKTVQQAFNAYKTFKEVLMKEVAEEFRSVLCPSAYNALLNYEVDIND